VGARAEVELVTMGALLHDIGKLWAQVPQRPPNSVHWGGCTRSGSFEGCPDCRRRFRYAHATLGARMAEALLGGGAGEVELVAFHHGQQPEIEHLLRYVQAGDHLSAGERDDRYDTAAQSQAVGRPFLIPPLAAPGSSVQLQPRALGAEWPPVHRASGEHGQAYQGLVDLWMRAAEAGQVRRLRGDARIEAALGLVENVGTLAPSAFYQTIPDISLAIHLQMAAAFAGALAAAGDPEADPAALLVVGDLSGIQAFIHRVPSTRAAKQLRARSFYLSLLSLVAARSIARAAGVTAANVLSVSGGNFQVLVPPDAEARVREEVRKLRGAIREVHGPDLDVVVAVTELRREEVTSYSQVVARAREELAIAKLRRLDDVLTPELFAPRSTGGSGEACRACGADEAEDRGDDLFLCDFCAGLVELGRELPQYRFLLVEPCEPADGHGWMRLFARMGWRIRLEASPPNPRPEEASLFALDVEALRDEPTARLLAVGKYVPRGDDGSPLDFERLAEKARGRPVLACAKVDIDDLGRFFRSFASGGQSGTTRDSPSRVASASRALSLFFEGYVDWLAESPEFRERLYLVFSGGDDAMVIGPWDAVLEFVARLREEFDEWTGRNPELHFSVGIAFGGKSRPVLAAMREAEGALQAAKLAEGKDRVTMFGVPLRWSDLRWIREFADRLAEDVAKGVSRGVLQDLLRASEAVQRTNPLGPPVYGPALWRIPHRVRRSGREGAQGLAERLADDVETELCQDGGPLRVAVAARLAEWRTFTGRVDDRANEPAREAAR